MKWSPQTLLVIHPGGGRQRQSKRTHSVRVPTARTAVTWRQFLFQMSQFGLFAVAAFLATLSTRRVDCEPTGAPESVCESMEPFHGPSPQPIDTSPYRVTTTAQDGYIPRDEYNSKFVSSQSRIRRLLEEKKILPHLSRLLVQLP